MNRIKKMWIYLLICILAFYLLPLTVKYWGNGMVLVLVALPCAVLVISAAYGIKNGFDLALPFFIGMIFLSTLFIFYNSSAWIYIVAYIVISIAGNGIGSLLHKLRN